MIDSRTLDRIRSGDRIFIAGSAGEPTALLEAWAADPPRTSGLEIVSSAVPGVNSFDFGRLDPGCKVAGLFMQPTFATLQRAGRFRHLPASYAGFVRDIRSAPQGFDVAVVQVAPPDADGNCSLGPAVEFMPEVLKRADRVIGIDNRATPRFTGAPSIAAARCDLIAEVNTPLPTYQTGVADAVSSRIAARIAEYIGDGFTIQMGLGKTPAALCDAIADRRRLRLRTGMYGEGVERLAGAGALAEGAVHEACVIVGSSALYEWAAERADLRLVGCEVSHDIGRPDDGERFVAVNGAVEADLSGQCALEHSSGAAVSGAGGAPDFARKARLCSGGLSIVALPSAALRGTVSRIVPRLSAPGVASLPRYDIDLLVTEYGVADLRASSVDERAEAIIEIAAPAFRAALRDAWAETLKNL